MIYFSKIFVVKQDREAEFSAWVDYINSHKDEAIATFEYEGINREVFVTFQGRDDRTYVIFSNEADQEPIPGDQSVPINAEHTRIKNECLEPIAGRGQVVVNLSTRPATM